MTRYVVAKWTSLAALLSAATVLSGCNTSAGKPTLCSAESQAAECKVAKKASADGRQAASERGGRNY